ncbi:hypothetical protein IF2G_00927 [Cordyceps javanica]|nr:hypothetical protein IF2G_00927 [Cordyceps javanica]
MACCTQPYTSNNYRSGYHPGFLPLRLGSIVRAGSTIRGYILSIYRMAGWDLAKTRRGKVATADFMRIASSTSATLLKMEREPALSLHLVGRTNWALGRYPCLAPPLLLSNNLMEHHNKASEKPLLWSMSLAGRQLNMQKGEFSWILSGQPAHCQVPPTSVRLVNSCSN